jgi:hypothetical protein
VTAEGRYETIRYERDGAVAWIVLDRHGTGERLEPRLR